MLNKAEQSDLLSSEDIFLSFPLKRVGISVDFLFGEVGILAHVPC